MSWSGRICLLGFGEVGTALAEDLLKATEAQLQVWDVLLVDAESHPARALRAVAPTGRVRAAPSAQTAALGCILTLSAVTAGQALAAAESVARSLAPGSWFVDFNSVSPETKDAGRRVVAAAGGRYVEAAVMSPFLLRRSATPMLLSGPNAAGLLEWAPAVGFSGMSLCSEQPGVAAAAKMCRSLIVKGTEALLAEALLAARHYGVETACLDSLGDLFPGVDWREQSRYMILRSLQHGTRRAEEMREAARTVQEAGVDATMSRATAERQAWAGRQADALDAPHLNALLDAIRQAASPLDTEDGNAG